MVVKFIVRLLVTVHVQSTNNGMGIVACSVLEGNSGILKLKLVNVQQVKVGTVILVFTATLERYLTQFHYNVSVL